MKKTTPKRLQNKAVTIKNLNSSFSDRISKLAKMIAKGNRNEEETRRWVIDILKNGFGYSDDAIETEVKTLGQRVDIVIKSVNQIILVIECKAANIKINQSAINQAANYATSLGADWALVTNGQCWQLYHVEAVKGSDPEIVEVFDVQLFDEDGLSKNDIQDLYLISEKSLLNGDTDIAYHYANIQSPEFIASCLLSENVINSVSKEILKQYKNVYGVKFDEIDKKYLHNMIKILLDVE